MRRRLLTVLLIATLCAQALAADFQAGAAEVSSRPQLT